MAPSLALWPKGLPVYLPLSVLTLQTTMPLLIRLSRKRKGEGVVHYNAAVMTLAAELVKTAVAMLCLITVMKRFHETGLKKVRRRVPIW